jgi:hypothetical protein
MAGTNATTDDSSASSSGGGVLSALGGLMRLADPSLLMNLGMGLMAGSRYGSNAGEGLLQGLQSYHQSKTANLQSQLQQQQLQEGQIGLQRQKMMMNAAQQALGQGQSTQAPPTAGLMGGQASQSPQQPFLPGISPMPAQGGLMGGATPQQAPQPVPAMPASLTPPSMEQIYGTTYPGGTSPQYTRAMAMFSQDPAAALLKARDDQLKLAQQNYAPTIAKLDTLIKSDTPSKYMRADPDLTAAWPQLAGALGMDPKADYNDQNVRLALTHVRNQMASSLSEATEAPVAPWRTTQGPLGSVLQTNPVSGEEKEVIKPEPLKDVVGPTGPVAVRASAAEGRQPFNATLFGAGNMSDQSKELAYQYYLQHQALPQGFARSPVMQADMMNYIAQRAQQEGNTQVSILANKQQNQAAQSVVKDYTSGKTAQTINGLNTSIQHMAALEPVVDAMGNGNLTVLNKAANFFKQQTGNPAPTNFAALKEFVSGEVAKAVLPGGGGEAERKALADPINAANSPAQLKQAIETYKTALAGKTEALRNQWDVGTRGSQGDFNKFLLPETKKALGIQDTGKTGVTLNPGESHAVGGFTVTRVN